MDRGATKHHLDRRRLMAIAIGATAMPAWLRHAEAQTEPWGPADGLRLAGPVYELETLDPALARDLPTTTIVRHICRGLVGYDEDLLPVPELAETIDVSPDQTTYTFVLREDARFHDGRVVEAEDVTWSFTRALHPATSELAGLPLAAMTFLGDIDGATELTESRSKTLRGIEAVDSRTVRITLEGPSTTFLMRLASVPASILDRSSDTSDPRWWLAMNGSGPYRIASIDPQTELVLRAVDRWRGDVVPVQDVHIRLGLSASAPENLLQNGELDLLDDAWAPLIPLLTDPATGLDGYQVFETPQFALDYVAFGGQVEPLDDLHIRRAIQRGFDVGRYIDAALGDVVIAPEGVIPSGVLGRAWRAELPEFDLDSARREVEASRYGNAASVPPIRIFAADVAPIEAMRDVLGRDLGLRIEAVQVNWADFLSGLSDRAWDAYSVFWGMDYPDPEALLRMLWSSSSADNYTGYHNDAFDAALDASRQEADDAARHDLYMEAQQMLIDDVAVIPLYVPRRYTVARPGFSHLPVTAFGLLALEKV